MAEEKIGGYYYELTAKDAGLKAGLKDAENSAYKAGEKIGQTLRKAFIAVTAAITGAVYAISKLVNSYQEQARAELKLQNAMKQTTGYSEDNYKGFIKLANELQNLIGVQDDAIINLMSMAKMQGITDANMKEAIQTTLDLSAAFGIDQAAALKAVSGAYAGNIDMLKRYVKNAELTKEEEEAGLTVIGKVSKAVSGQAQILADTSNGASKLNVMVGELTESVGKKLVPAFVSLVKFGMEAVDFIYSLLGAGNALEVSQRKLNEAVSNYNILLAKTPEQINAMTASEQKLYDLQLKLAELELAKSTQEFLKTLPEVANESETWKKILEKVNGELKLMEENGKDSIVTTNLMGQATIKTKEQVLGQIIELEKKLAENEIKTTEGAINMIELLNTKSASKMLPFFKNMSDNQKQIFKSAYDDMYDMSKNVNKQIVQDAITTLNTLKQAGFFSGVTGNVEYGTRMTGLQVLLATLKDDKQSVTSGVLDDDKGHGGLKKIVSHLKEMADRAKEFNTEWLKIEEVTRRYEEDVKELTVDWSSVLESLKGISPEMDGIIDGTQGFIAALQSADPVTAAIKLAIDGMLASTMRMKAAHDKFLEQLEAEKKLRQENLATSQAVAHDQLSVESDRLNAVAERLEMEGKDDEAQVYRVKAIKAQQNSLRNWQKEWQGSIDNARAAMDRGGKSQEEMNALALEITNLMIKQQDAANEIYELDTERLDIEKDITDEIKAQNDARLQGLQDQIDLGLIDVENVVQASGLQTELAAMGYSGVGLASQLSGLGVSRQTYQTVNNTQYIMGSNGFQIADEFKVSIGKTAGGV